MCSKHTTMCIDLPSDLPIRMRALATPPLQVYRLVAFLKFMHRPMHQADFERLDSVVALRALGNELVPDARSKEPKATTFSHLPDYRHLLRGVVDYCTGKNERPRHLREVWCRALPAQTHSIALPWRIVFYPQ